MTETLFISSPIVELGPIDRKVRLQAKISGSGKDDYILWYEVDEEYASFLCFERSDAFVIALLPYAMKHNLSISCEKPLSEKLYYQLTQILIPALSKNVESYHHIDICCDISREELPSANAIGASLSGGVDSFYTLLNHIDKKSTGFNISHLTFFNVGASGDHGGEQARKLYHDRIAFVRDVAADLNLPLVCVDSNLSEYLHMSHVSCHTFRTLSAVMSLQKLFSKYLFASGYPFDKFSFSAADSGCYDLLTTQCLSNEQITIILSGAEKTRLEKVNFIADYPITYSKLNVCFEEESNCSQCPKCRRTMMELYLGDKLEKYNQVFDVNRFFSNIEYLLVIACRFKKLTDWDEIYIHLNQKNLIKFRHHILAATINLGHKFFDSSKIFKNLCVKLRSFVLKR